MVYIYELQAAWPTDKIILNEESGGVPLVVAMLGKNVEEDRNEILKRMGKIMRLVLWKI